MELHEAAIIVLGIIALPLIAVGVVIPHWRSWRLHREVTRSRGYRFPPGKRMP